jgi:guanine nucleotide-binding protein alpha-1 subunit
MGGSIDSMDPLAQAIAPPEDETPEERETRLRKEADDKRVSDDIDEQIRQEKAELRKKKRVVKVLLLGQAESGVSYPPACTSCASLMP